MPNPVKRQLGAAQTPANDVKRARPSAGANLNQSNGGSKKEEEFVLKFSGIPSDQRAALMRDFGKYIVQESDANGGGAKANGTKKIVAHDSSSTSDSEAEANNKVRQISLTGRAI